MNLGRGFPVPQEKQITQNGNYWTPVTPGKPVAERPNYPQAEMQQNQIEPENWQELLGIYSDVLHDEPVNGLPRRSNVDGHPGPSYREQNLQGVVICSSLPQNFNGNVLEQNHREPSTRHGVVQPNFLQNRAMEQNLQAIAPFVPHSSQNFNTNGVLEQKRRESSSQYGVSPNFHQNRAISSNFHQNGAVSPNVHQNLAISSNVHQSVAVSPSFHQNRVIPSNFQQNVPISSNFQRNRTILSNIHHNGVVSPNSYNNRAILPASGEHNIGNAALVGSMNHNAGGNGSHMPNLGKATAPQKVHSLAELLGSMNGSPHAALTNGEPSSSTYIKEKHKGVHPVSQGRVSNQLTHSTSGVLLQQNHTLQPNRRISNYHLPPATNTVTSPVPSRPSYNLNFPPRSEDGESSSSSALNLLNQLWPATPDQQRQSNNYHTNPEPSVQVDEMPNQEKDLQGDGIFMQQPEIVEISSNEFVQTTGTSSVSTPSKEMNNLDGGATEAGIDLNKTPAAKTPKRKKHRPKVVREGKPKKTPKTTPKSSVVSTKKTPPDNTPDGTPRVKRKYVRRKGIETPATPTDAAKKGEVTKVKSVAKSCKRSINFDAEEKIEKESQHREFDYQAQNDEGNKVPIDLNVASNTEWSAEFNDSLLEGRHHAIDGKEKHQQPDSLYNHVPPEHIPPQESVAFKAQPSAPKNHALNVIARSLSLRNPNVNLSGEHLYDSIHHCLGGGLSQIVIQASSNGPDLDGRRQQMLHSNAQILESSSNIAGKQGSQRNNFYSEMAPPQSVVLMGSPLWSNGLSKRDENTGCSSIVHKNCSDGIKRSRIEDRCGGNSSVVISETTDLGDCSGLTQNRGKQTIQGQNSRLCAPSNAEANRVNYDCYINSARSRYKFQQQGASSSQVHQFAERSVQKISSQFSNNMQNAIPLTTVSNFNQESTSGREPQYAQGNEVLRSPVNVPAKEHTKQPSQKEIVVVDRGSQNESKALQIYGHSSKKLKGSRGKKKLFSVDDITDFLKDLSIHNTGKEIVRGVENALVPYKGTGGSIIPYEAVKRRVPRPKVDLDPETNRLWNLLMGKEGGETSEQMDANKQKWWEDERSIFAGRVGSFIARMHDVQGDRRFSRWKGSVVDSVIGVFLTQNVSDHLSSSAFMSLAAKFPIKSRAGEACHENGRGSDGQNKVRVTFPDETPCDQDTSRETTCLYSSVTSAGSARAENAMMGSRSRLVTDNFRVEEDIFSSQSSSESFIYQVSEDIRSSSGSNSEADDQLLGRNFNLNYSPVNPAEQAKTTAPYLQQQFQGMGSSFPDKSPLVNHQPSEKSLFGEYLGVASGRDVTSHPSTFEGLHDQTTVTPSAGSWLSMLTGPDKWDGDSLGFLGKECTSSLASADFGSITGLDEELGHDKADQCAETSFTAQEAGVLNSQASLAHRGIVNKYIGQQADPSAVSQGINDQRFTGASQKESTFQADSTKAAETSSAQPSNNVHKYTGSKEMGQVQSSGGPASEPSTANTPTPNGKKRKAEKEKVEPINWDTLREQVHLKNGPPTGINPNALDSLDYETLRNADVREISDAIKERGMNNMLAERIKDFLNRLVRDHGRVDLEWLRDVQPDKAKDYLLSIRGLGLKSVECVRLLTLHHLAFPVDTNVGRIAVRLGWVPLQPLPESLQLHLLEMYPVLESIQKYLWPRLCKLDQGTLYELHYQMITFGKVFCTKRDPNCNACPLRAECRHFASAFASARLALPGPEEKRIVTSADPIGAQRVPEVPIRPVRLLPPGSNMEGEMGFNRNCEPIIEEPKTPEAPTEVWEKDIEDAFFEDPDEIPVIKLNLKEFTSNLQSFMQEHMEMQEGDMSRALVALSPELASIPTPKLKNVSRLRTEHQVYELPDSHPLLEGMDRREPDDPSPYLLAIWTPGETADSIQPPESICSSSEGGPCNLSTCFSCNSVREANAQTVRGTILIPCRTAMRGSFPLNGTYFQVNELFADHESSINPIDVPRSLVWPLQRRTVYFGTSVSTIFKGLPVQQIQQAFWRGFVCVRGFCRKSRAPRPLKARLHFPASKIVEQNKQKKANAAKENTAKRE